ncbi:alpha-N-acetylglucosaminidase [Flagellimonas sp.]|uniref:alpha-N-acetylglucosaminidase n=1 Tax=Flagellimonas sp. TaxID=2058762 RepID=UPI003B50D03D
MRSNIILSLFVVFLCSNCNLQIQKKEKIETPIHKLLERIAPGHVDFFVFELSEMGKDFFSLESEDDLIMIKGNNYNSVAVGLNYYLKNYCRTYVSWFADDKVNLPEVLPKVTGVIEREARVDDRFFLNYCTFGYTMPWWQWNDWERFIDWMALNGVTMPLAITGQEAIWYEVWKELGLQDDEIRSYFTGPAHLPWHRMSNLDKWGGPLPMSWLSHQKNLQTKILKRERELGMTPVLPAFAGHVPQALSKVFPEAKINQLSSWGGFKDEYRSYFLDPLDPLFKDIQHRFLNKQTELYGTDHIYGADPFNEVHPPSWEPDYLATVANTIFTSMKEVDTQASWLQMSWIFYFERSHWTNERIKAMVRAVPQDKMMLLDYFCENEEVWKMTDSFFGQPFLWNYLGNFGGNTMLAGNLDEVETRMEYAFQNSHGNLWGVGSTLEALDVNPLMYAYVFEKPWSDGSVDTGEWIKNWADVRYGKSDKDYQHAWEILHKNVYKDHTALGQATLTNARPTLAGHGNWTTNPQIQYDNAVLSRAWESMLKTPSELRDTYAYDIVNVGRQFLGNHFMVLRDNFAKSYANKDLSELQKNGQAMLDLLDDLDELLSSENSFLLGKWLNDAKAMGIDENEKDYFEHNARNIITTWGTKAQSLNDYANRSLGGLTMNYYKQRWQMFIDDVITALKENKEYDASAFMDKVTQFEWDWTLQKNQFPDQPIGDPVEISKRLISKYKSSSNSKQTSP